MKVLVAGVAGASLGTELLKCLSLVDGYQVYACDISPLAYGLYSEGIAGSYVVDNTKYVQSIIDICTSNGIRHIIPGGEQPTVLLASASSELAAKDIKLVSNDPQVIKLFSDKHRTFEFLASHGFSIPKTYHPEKGDDLAGIGFPCIVKPSADTGGSDSVFLATNKEECLLYIELLKRNNRKVLVQEYIALDEGEFTVGVLSDPDSNIIGSVAMKRTFNSKLSVGYKGQKGLISSGYSQGLIADFADIRKQAEKIAQAAGSKGPLNVQGRVRNGILIPFEINPRFSASTYLRAMAGFNEVKLFLGCLQGQKAANSGPVREGYYVRTFNEMFIPKDKVPA